MNDFFASIYEGFNPLNIFYIEFFSDDMYESGVYSTIGWLMILSSILVVVLYYFFISNLGKLYKTAFWLVIIGVIALINYMIGFYFSMNAMNDFYTTSEEGNPYGFFEYSQFGLYNVLWAVLLSIIVSLIVKGKSIKASKTPF